MDNLHGTVLADFLFAKTSPHRREDRDELVKACMPWHAAWKPRTPAPSPRCAR